jgi:hypothetical protein
MTKEAMDRLINQAHPFPRRRLKAYELPGEKYAAGPGMDLEGQLEASIEWVEHQKRSMNEKKGLTTMSEKLQLEKGVWAEIALKYTDGKDFSNEYGESVMFSLVDGRVVFVPMLAAARIRALGLSAGEVFGLRKAEVKVNGGRPTVEWQVRRVGEQPDGTFAIPKETATASSVAAPATGTTQPLAFQPTPPQGANNPTNGHGSAPSPFEHSGHAALLRETTCMLIDVLASCKGYAAKYNGAIALDDVKNLLITTYINSKSTMK